MTAGGPLYSQGGAIDLLHTFDSEKSREVYLLSGKVMALMRELTFKMRVKAPIERCFDLSRSISLHSSLEPRHEAVAGVTRGLIGKGETVSWRGRIFGIPVSHTSLVDEYERPFYFRDVMIKGLFRVIPTQTFPGKRRRVYRHAR
jgi:hypothetical protein